ncbi:MAG: hypothetical protein ACFFCW_36340 [Candidatus Hodarchaeota archaeon]
MKKLAITITGIGVALLLIALISATRIPWAANKDFDRWLESTRHRVSYTPGFPDVYKQICANRRILQNFYIGAAGLICLAVGLGNLNRSVKKPDAPDGEDAAADP